MDPLQTPQTKETKDFLENKCGLRPYTPVKAPAWADPDNASYHVVSLAIFGLSAAGRWQAGKFGLTRWPWTVSMLLVPFFHTLSVYQKEKRFPYINTERRSFEQNLEFYPVTRRAWNRAMQIYSSETGGNTKQE